METFQRAFSSPCLPLGPAPARRTLGEEIVRRGDQRSLADPLIKRLELRAFKDALAVRARKPDAPRFEYGNDVSGLGLGLALVERKSLRFAEEFLSFGDHFQGLSCRNAQGGLYQSQV